MTARSEASLYLEDLQENAYRKLGIPLDEIKARKKAFLEAHERAPLMMFSVEDMFSLKPEEAAWWYGVGKSANSLFGKVNTPTPYELPGTYWLMSSLAEDIERLQPKSPQKELPRPVFGTLPTGKVNARAILVPTSNEYLLVFESEIFTFCNLLSKIIAQSLPFNLVGSSFEKQGQSREESDWTYSLLNEDIAKNIRENRQIQLRFEQLLLAYILQGSPSFAPRYMLRDPHLSFASLLRRPMELFIMGHEYGHIIGEHHKASKIVSGNILGMKVNEIQYQGKEESEADFTGLYLTLQIAKEYGYPGAVLVFAGMDVLQRSLSVFSNGVEYPPDVAKHESRGSHPPPSFRREIAQEFMTGTFNVHPSSFPLVLGSAIDKIMKMLWESTRPTIFREYKMKKRVNPRWQTVEV
jgi:hypothetical protein